MTEADATGNAGSEGGPAGASTPEEAIEAAVEEGAVEEGAVEEGAVEEDVSGESKAAEVSATAGSAADPTETSDAVLPEEICSAELMDESVDPAVGDGAPAAAGDVESTEDGCGIGLHVVGPVADLREAA